jgi:hypothetical protein
MSHKTFTIIGAKELDEYQDEYGNLHFEGKDASDGYHTMTELYEHRHALFCALTKIYDNYITPLGSRVKCWKSKLHSDGTMYPDSFIAGMQVTEFDKIYSITYHLPLSWWDRFKVMELPTGYDWDGHDSSMTIERLLKL